ADQGGIERNRQNRRIMPGIGFGQDIEHRMRGNVIFCLGRYDADTEPCRRSCDFRSRGPAPPSFGDDAFGNGLCRVTVYQEQFHIPCPIQSVNGTWMAAAAFSSSSNSTRARRSSIKSVANAL